MRKNSFVMVKRTPPGTYQEVSTTGETVRAFVPAPLPPSNPALQQDEALLAALTGAEQALGRLEVGAQLVPSLDWFLYSMIRREALLSSQIEGTQSTLEDLFEYEHLGPTALDVGSDIDEVACYIEAMHYARKQLLRKKGLPISVRLLNEAHRRLLAQERGRTKSPGKLRSSQNWIGGTRPGNAVFVPPPPERVPDLMADLERFVHQPSDLPDLMRIGLVHVQFETIHPYLDGNGRLGRLLIALLIEEWGLLPTPVLVASLELKRRRNDYYRWLEEVRVNGDWEGWLLFFFECIEVAAEETLTQIRALFHLTQKDRAVVLAGANSSLGAVRLFELLPERPVLNIASVMDVLQTTRPTATAAVMGLVEAGVLAELPSAQRGRVFSYRKYIEILSQDANPLT